MAEKSEETLQQMQWTAASTSIEELLRNASPLVFLSTTIPRIFDFNLALYKGLFASLVVNVAIEKAELIPALACLVSIVNSKIPEIGRLCLLIAVHEYRSWRRSCRASDKRKRACVLIAHLCNQGVCDELLPLEILLDLLMGEKNPVECLVLAEELTRHAGAHLSSRPALKEALDSVFAQFKDVLKSRKDIPQALSEQLNDLQALRKKNFSAFPAIPIDYDILVDKARITHEVSLDDDKDVDKATDLGAFTPIEKFELQNQVWAELKHEFLDEEYEPLDEEPEPDQEEFLPEAPSIAPVEQGVQQPPPPVAASAATSNAVSTAGKVVSQQTVDPFVDKTSHDVVAVRKRIYLTLNHGLVYEQVVHELLLQRQRELRGQDHEIVAMIVEACAQAKTYTDFIGLIATRLCRAVPEFTGLFQAEFQKQYEGIHRLETNKIRNIGMLFAQLLYADCVSWENIFANVIIDEDTTTSASRIFLKFVFQKLAQLMGIDRLKAKLTPLSAFKGLFPTKPRTRTRFAINFFTSIELGTLTLEMREWLTNGAPDDDDSASSFSSSSSSSSGRDKRKRSRKRSKKSKKSSSKKHKKSRSRRRSSDSSSDASR